MKLTFKNQPRETGLSGVGYPNVSVDIKIDGKVCGHISAPNYLSEDSLYRVWFSIMKKDILEDKNPNRPWKWVRLKKTFESSGEARKFLKENYEKILAGFTPYFSK